MANMDGDKQSVLGVVVCLERLQLVVSEIQEWNECLRKSTSPFPCTAVGEEE